MLLLNEILSKGFDGQQLLSGLALFFRDLLVCKDPQTIVLFEAGDAIKQKYVETAARCNESFLYKAIELTNDTDLNYRVSKNKRLSIELLLIRLCQLNNSSSEEDKKKMLIEPIAEFSSIKVEQPKIDNSSTQTIVNKVNNVSENLQPVKQGILRASLKKETEETKSSSMPEDIMQQIQAESFNEEQLQAAWKSYANELTDKHLKSIMMYLNPELKENDTVEIYALNPDQIHFIQENSNQIKEYLFSRLRNNRIQLEIKIKEDTTENLPFTDHDKYTYMANKNPLLNKLVKEFDLRLD
jgi:DNA polymerase-3 subunit gamma/tau